MMLFWLFRWKLHVGRCEAVTRTEIMLEYTDVFISPHKYCVWSFGVVVGTLTLY